jgi:hypothetical protein
MVRATNRTKFIILFLFENKRRLNRCEGLKNVLCALIKELFVWFVLVDEYVSALSSAFAQHGAEFQVPSAPDSLRAIGNPKMYKPTQQFFSLAPGPRHKEDRRGTNHPRRQKFLHPRSSTRSPLPMVTFWGSMSHIVLALFHLFQMIARQADHGHGIRIASRKRHGTRRKRQFGDIFSNYLISIVHPHSESRLYQ